MSTRPDIWRDDYATDAMLARARAFWADWSGPDEPTMTDFVEHIMSCRDIVERLPEDHPMSRAMRAATVTSARSRDPVLPDPDPDDAMSLRLLWAASSPEVTESVRRHHASRGCLPVVAGGLMLLVSLSCAAAASSSKARLARRCRLGSCALSSTSASRPRPPSPEGMKISVSPDGKAGKPPYF